MTSLESRSLRFGHPFSLNPLDSLTEIVDYYPPQELFDSLIKALEDLQTKPRNPIMPMNDSLELDAVPTCTCVLTTPSPFCPIHGIFTEQDPDKQASQDEENKQYQKGERKE